MVIGNSKFDICKDGRSVCSIEKLKPMQTISNTVTLIFDNGNGSYVGVGMDQMKEFAAIVKRYIAKKANFVTIIKGIRDAAEAQKDSIPKEYHTAIDLLLFLIDKKIDELEQQEKEDIRNEGH